MTMAQLRGTAPTDGRRLGAYVYDVLKECLLEGQWGAGESIAVEAVKLELGVSKQPVMDALRRLAADGLVEIRPQVGCRVPTYSLGEVSDFFTMFACVDSEATAVAAQRGTAIQLARLSTINELIGALPQLADAGERRHRYRVLNRQFHEVILQMTHSAMIDRTTRRMWDMSDMLINATGMSYSMVGELAERHADHEQIIAALRRGDAHEARRYSRAHILRNVAILDGVVPGTGDTAPED